MKYFILLSFVLISIHTIAQPPLNLKNKKCLSGNCENGIGRLSLPEMNNLILDGKFTKGILNGDGKAWYISSRGTEYIAEWGKFTDGYLRSGTVYNDVAMPVSYGEYNYTTKGKRYLKNGTLSIKYRGKEAQLNCSEIIYDEVIDDIVPVGLVNIYEGYFGTEDGRQLAQFTYKGAKRDGNAWEWDYENSLKHYLYYDKGVLSDTNRIKSITSNQFIAKEVKYLHPKDESFIYNIEQGTFAFNGGPARFMICNTGDGNINFFKKDYITYNPFDYSYRNGKIVRKTNEEIAKMKNGIPKISTSTEPEKAGTKYNATTVALCKSDIASLNRRALYALAYYRDANQDEKGYAANRRAYQQYQKEIIPDCEKAISKYQGEVPSQMINELKDIRDALKNHNLPMGILKSMPTSRD